MESHNEVPADHAAAANDAAAPHVPLAHSPEQEKLEHGEKAQQTNE